MTKITAVPEDKIIIKDGAVETVNDDSFWANYSGVHAIQIDTDGISWIENKNAPQSTPTQTQIDAILNKYEITKSARETAEQTKADNILNTWDRVRQDRGTWITLTDKYLLSDYPISESNRALIQTYRTSLRDLPETYSNEEPRNIIIDDSGNVSVNGTQVITFPSI